MIYIGEKVDKSVWMRVFAAPPSNSSSKLIPFNWPSKIIRPPTPLSLPGLHSLRYIDQAIKN